MGYDTKYSLAATVQVPIPGPIDPIETLRQESAEAEFALSNGAGKWYEHEDELRHLSARFPEYLFTLEGQGEELGDSWTKYFQAGKMHKAEQIVEPFDPQKLK